MKSKWIKAGVIGVDAGLCWIGDPCYIAAKDASNVFEKWSDFCNTLEKNEVEGVCQWNTEYGHPGLGVSVESGYGDGEYPVYIRRNEEGRVVEVKVVFD
jgi:hypothetical protein